MPMLHRPNEDRIVPDYSWTPSAHFRVGAAIARELLPALRQAEQIRSMAITKGRATLIGRQLRAHGLGFKPLKRAETQERLFHYMASDRRDMHAAAELYDHLIQQAGLLHGWEIPNLKALYEKNAKRIADDVARRGLDLQTGRYQHRPVTYGVQTTTPTLERTLQPRYGVNNVDGLHTDVWRHTHDMLTALDKHMFYSFVPVKGKEWKDLSEAAALTNPESKRRWDIFKSYKRRIRKEADAAAKTIKQPDVTRPYPVVLMALAKEQIARRDDLYKSYVTDGKMKEGEFNFAFRDLISGADGAYLDILAFLEAHAPKLYKYVPLLEPDAPILEKPERPRPHYDRRHPAAAQQLDAA